MAAAQGLFKRFRGKSGFRDGKYIDIDGDDIASSDNISCLECVFRYKSPDLLNPGCSIYKEKGLTDSEIKSFMKGVSLSNPCEFFLWDGCDDGDEIRRKARAIGDVLYKEEKSEKMRANELSDKKENTSISTLIWILVGLVIFMILTNAN